MRKDAAAQRVRPMSLNRSFRRSLIALALVLTMVAPAGASDGGYMTGFKRWRGDAGGFRGWQRDGVLLTGDGSLRLDPGTARADSDPYGPGGFHGHDYYNGGGFLVGEALSPVTSTYFCFQEATPSWNADTPAGTWIETQLRARLRGRWTRWYNLGIWATDTSTIERHSVDEQEDADGHVDTDTLIVTNHSACANALQLKLRLFSTDGVPVPVVYRASLTYSKKPLDIDSFKPGRPDRWDHVLEVPECSQMVYPDGGDVWCSPTSTAMVLAYWTNDEGPCEPGVRAAAAGTYDWLYEGNGNWPFNAAYAATHGLEGYVARLSSLAEAEKWIEAGVPVICSLAWGRDELTGAPFQTSDGHLVVLVGFDAAGNPVVNDPGASTDEAVQRTYLRSEFESLWLGHAGGTVYLMYPSDWPVPRLRSQGRTPRPKFLAWRR